MNSFLNNFLDNDNVVHAVGRVQVELLYPAEGYYSTKIIWKNKFVGDRLQDEYETYFGVYY